MGQESNQNGGLRNSTENDQSKETVSTLNSIKEEAETPPKSCKVPIGGILALLGGFFIQLTLGSFYSFGNVMTYMTSYMRAHGSPNITYQDFIMVQSVWGMTQGTIMPISGFIIRFIGPRLAMFGGCAIFSFGTAMTYFTVSTGSLLNVCITYGFVQALGQSIALIPTMTIGMKWFPKNKGIAMGVVVGGFGGGSFIFNQIQTAILNPDNVSVDEGSEYFTDPDVLGRVPGLMLSLAAIFFTIQMIACFMVTEPPGCKAPPELTLEDQEEEGDVNNDHKEVCVVKDKTDTNNVEPWDALKVRYFYLLWMTRFSVVLITQTIAGFYKVFGQSFIKDDHFFALVGAISSLFNCSGRLMYGLIMDKSTYRTAMTMETVLLACLLSTLYLTTYGGKVMYAIWIWGIFLTFPGTYSTQPAVTTQTFGHKNGGLLYGFLFTSDIPNNLLVGLLSKPIYQAFGYIGLFLVLSLFGVLGAIITCFFPWHPSPKMIMEKVEKKKNSDAAELSKLNA